MDYSDERQGGREGVRGREEGVTGASSHCGGGGGGDAQWAQRTFGGARTGMGVREQPVAALLFDAQLGRQRTYAADGPTKSPRP